jgi:hypothetical protein
MNAIAMLLIAAATAAGADEAQLRRQFFSLCDAACRELNTESRKVPFYHDSYAVRGLGVAYDMTGRPEYLAVCRKWTDRMLDFQDRMTPRGAYYMNYGRKPGAPQGDWYIGDSSSIALAVLATAMRTPDAAARSRYFESVNAYARLVIDNYVRPSGGVTDGLWSQFDGEWWCSTGIFGSLAFVLYKQTGDEAYLKIGRGALDWLNRQGFENSKHISWKEAAPSVVMYVFEAYSAGMPYLEPGSPLEKTSLAEIRRALRWMADNQVGRGAKTSWDYAKQWGSKMGGLPFHMLVYARHLPEGQQLTAAADEELRYLGEQQVAQTPAKLTQLACFTLMSMAERLQPGFIYRTDRGVAYPGTQPGPAAGKLSDGRLVLENRLLQARWTVTDERLALEGFVDRSGNHTLRSLDGAAFKLILDDGRSLSSTDFRPVGRPALVRLAARPEAVQMAERWPGWQARVELASRDGSLRVTWQAVLRDGAHYLRQQLTLRAEKPGCRVREIAFLELPAEGVKPGGAVEGSPLLTGPWFLGCEHPMAANRVQAGRATCAVGLFETLEPGRDCSRTAAIGILPRGQARRGFLSYLERERPRPFQPFLHYNSWYDIAWVDRKMDERGCLEVMDLLGRELVAKRGTRLDSFVFDDGWDDNRTLWLFHPGFPRGFTPLSELAARYQSGVGVWLSPWGGYAQAKTERMKYGRQQGFEMNDRGFSLAGPKYYARFRQACADMVEKYQVNYFKYDGIASGIGAAGAGSKYAADIDGLLRLVADLRRLRADLFVNITTGTWPSPYWLLWGDSIWRNGADMGFHGPGPRRQQWITYRDMITYQWIVRKAPLYPLNSLMTQGIAHAKLGSANLPPDLRDMADEIRSFFASGTQLQELYITPQMFSGPMWDLLAEGAQWNRRSRDVLVDVHWVGGDPGQQQPYGFAAWSARQGMLALRNPSPAAATIAIDVREAFELPADAITRYRLVAPWKDAPQREHLTLEAGRPRMFQLEPFEVLVFDALPSR